MSSTKPWWCSNCSKRFKLESHVNHHISLVLKCKAADAIPQTTEDVSPSLQADHAVDSAFDYEPMDLDNLPPSPPAGSADFESNLPPTESGNRAANVQLDDDPSVIETFEGAGKVHRWDTKPSNQFSAEAAQRAGNLWYPFKDEAEANFAQWVLKSKTSNADVDALLNDPEVSLGWLTNTGYCLISSS